MANGFIPVNHWRWNSNSETKQQNWSVLQEASWVGQTQETNLFAWLWVDHYIGIQNLQTATRETKY